MFLFHVESAPICLKLIFQCALLKRFTFSFPTYSFRVLGPQSNQTTVCHKLYAVKMVSQNYQMFSRSDFANKNTLLIISCLFVYVFLKGKDGKDGQNGEIFNNFSPLFYHEKLFICFFGTITNSICFPHRKRWSWWNKRWCTHCFVNVKRKYSSTLIHCGICKESRLQYD